MEGEGKDKETAKPSMVHSQNVQRCQDWTSQSQEPGIWTTEWQRLKRLKHHELPPRVCNLKKLASAVESGVKPRLE